jgi:glycosyltransferase involved in cell wall biosynthesis
MSDPHGTAPITSVIIPAFNEETSIGLVLDKLPQERLKEIIVVNNGSTDKTACVAKKHGARVVDGALRGYGAAYRERARSRSLH